MKPSEQDIAILRAFSVGGAMTAYELAAQMLAEREASKIACDRLWSHRLVDREYTGRGRASIYTLSAKGRRLLERLEPKSMGQMPAPRDRSTAGPYRGEKPIVTRPGSGDAFNLPSRRGDSLVPHALPLSIAGGDPA